MCVSGSGLHADDDGIVTQVLWECAKWPWANTSSRQQILTRLVWWPQSEGAWLHSTATSLSSVPSILDPNRDVFSSLYHRAQACVCVVQPRSFVINGHQSLFVHCMPIISMSSKRPSFPCRSDWASPHYQRITGGCVDLFIDGQIGLL